MRLFEHRGAFICKKIERLHAPDRLSFFAKCVFITAALKLLNVFRRMTTSGKESRLIWIDCEMTGLNVNSATLVEIACIITEADLHIVAEGPNLVIHQPDYVLERMNSWCKTTFANNGLLDAIRSSKISMESAEKKMLTFLNEHTNAGECPLAGNSVGFDRRFIDKYMPHLGRHFHYRSVDVSSIKEIVKRWYPDKYALLPKKKGAHLALSDIKESIEELKWYKNNVFFQI